MKKKVVLLTYIFTDFIFNFILVQLSSLIVMIDICYLVNGHFLPHQISNIKNRIDGALGILIFLSIYISINI